MTMKPSHLRSLMGFCGEDFHQELCGADATDEPSDLALCCVAGARAKGGGWKPMGLGEIVI